MANTMNVFGGDDQFGYNHIEIGKIHDEVDTIGKATAKAIEDVMSTDIVQPMSTLWYAPEAIEFFTSFKGTVEAAAMTLTSAFNGFIVNVNSAQQAWSEKTGGGKQTPVEPIGTLTITIDISSIKDENAGSIVLYTTKARAHADSLTAIQAKLEKAIADQKAALENLNQAFLGGGQGAAVEHCFEVVLAAIAQIFDFLTKGQNSLQNQINAAADTYTKMAEQVTSGMNSATVNEG
jgi:hypothetical protein